MRLVNLVGTRAARGEHAALVRWYADHVHQLLAFPGLLGAALHRRVGDHDGAPEYLCLYDFADRDAFDAYEHSDVHKSAAQDRAAGWGREGIEITVRTQFERLYGSGSTAASAEHCFVHALHAAPAQERALAVHAVERASASFMLLRAAVAPAMVADYLLIEHASDPIAPLRGFSVAWHAGYARLRRWWR